MDSEWRPSWVDWLLVAAIGLLAQGFWAVQLEHPTYMDAYYYSTNGRQLAKGAGFNEMIIWQFLDEPEGLPTPSHTYWMPLTSIIASAGYRLTGTFGGAQIPFWLMGGLLPLLAFAVSWQLAGLRWQAWAAALFTAAGSFYAAFLSQPSTFGPFAWAGGGCLLVLAVVHQRFDKSVRFVKSRWLLVGILAGLAHLTRADGVLFLVLGLVFWGWEVWRGRSADMRRLARRFGPPVGLILGGYLLVMGWWFVHSWQVMGRPLSTVGTQSMFLTTYDDLFAYGRSFDLAGYLDWGLGNIMRSKVYALWLGVQSLFVVSGMVFLAPFIIVGWMGAFRDVGQRRFLRPFSLYTFIMFLVLTLVFTFPGERGSIFHSSIAIWPWMAALAAFGIGLVVDWTASKLPHWKPERAKRLFSALFIGIAFVVSLVIGMARLAPDPSIETYGRIAADIPNGSKVMVGIAPAFYYHTQIAAVSVPNEPVEIVLEAAERYGITHLILDQNHPAPLRDIYTGDEVHGRVLLVETYDENVKLYGILPDNNSRFNQFLTSEEVPEETPLSITMPAFMPWAYPQPESVIDLKIYREGFSYSTIDPRTEEIDIIFSVPDAICVKLDAGELVEINDDGLDYEDYIDRSSLTVDGSLWNASSPDLLFDELSAIRGITQTVNIETGEKTGEDLWNAGGPFTICWPVELEQGLHHVEFQSRTTSGQLFSFEWEFHIGS